MVPTTVVGVLVFVASVGPGYLYVKILERWRPYTERTALRETAQIVVSGSLATLVGVIVALIVGRKFNFISTDSLARHPVRYVVNHPGDAGLGVLVILCVSYGLAALVARYMPGKGAEVFPDSAWYSTFERRLPKEHAILATVELRDGRRVTGLLQAFTAEQTPLDDRELTLTSSTTDTMKVVLPSGGEPSDLKDQFLMLRGSDIANVAASYVPLDAAPTAPGGA